MTFNKQKWSKEYYFKNRNRILAYNKKWAKENQDKMKVIRRRWRISDSGITKNRELANKWAKKNKEYVHHNASIQNARRRNAKGNHSLREWQDLKKKYNYRCVGCGKKKKLTKDHIKPIIKGGTNYISNIQPLCFHCNTSKKEF